MERNNKRNDTLAFCLGILLAGVMIQAAGWLKGDRLVFPDVGKILAAFVHLLGTGETGQQIGTTLLHLAEALAVSSAIGVALGLLQGRSPFIRTLLKPLMILLRSIPMIVMTVIIMVLTKYDRVPLIAPTLMLIPLISEATGEGLRRIEPEYIDVYRMNSGFTPRVVFQVYLPLMAGYLKQSYVNAVGMGIKLAVTTNTWCRRETRWARLYTAAHISTSTQRSMPMP